MMTSDEINVVKAFMAAISRRDIAAMSALMTEDHTFIDSGGTVVSGRETMTTGWEGYFRMFPDYEVQAETVLADGPIVSVFGKACGTYNGKRGLIPANRIEMPAAWKAVVENGKVKFWQVYADWAEGSKIIEEDEKSGQ